MCECRFNSRRRASPYPGKGDIYVLVDACMQCDRMRPVYPERLSHREADWIRRWNARVGKWEEQLEKGREG